MMIMGARDCAYPMGDRCYFVSPLHAPAPRKGWLLASDECAICEFFSESAALSCARSLALLDCAAGRSAIVYEIRPLGRVVMRWRCHGNVPELIEIEPEA